MSADKSNKRCLNPEYNLFSESVSVDNKRKTGDTIGSCSKTGLYVSYERLIQWLTTSYIVKSRQFIDSLQHNSTVPITKEVAIILQFKSHLLFNRREACNVLELRLCQLPGPNSPIRTRYILRMSPMTIQFKY